MYCEAETRAALPENHTGESTSVSHTDRHCVTSPASEDEVRASGAANGSRQSPAQQRIHGIEPSHGGAVPSGVTSHLVFALGRLSFDYGPLARRRYFMSEFKNANLPAGIDDPGKLVTYLTREPVNEKGKPADLPYTILAGDNRPTSSKKGNQFVNRTKVTSITWTLNIDDTPIYAIQPSGAFSFEVYDRLVEFLKDQTDVEDQFASLRAEDAKLPPEKRTFVTSAPDMRISVPGYVAGETQLYSGETVPVIYPELRGMFSWTTLALTEATQAADGATPDAANALAQFLHRVYDDTRNLGLTSEDRALNYAATDALTLQTIFSDIRARHQGFEFDTFEVERSPICRADSDCWDVKLLFYDPSELRRARRVVRFTVDVSDVVPVVIGRRKDFSAR